jgi:hypothetical protein
MADLLQVKPLKRDYELEVGVHGIEVELKTELGH